MVSSINEEQKHHNDDDTVDGRQHEPKRKEEIAVHVVVVGCNDRSNNTYSGTDRD